MILLETLRCEDGRLRHVSYHQQRLDETLRHLGIGRSYDLHSLILPPEHGLWRCRFLYGADGYEVRFHPYRPRTFSSLKLIRTDEIDYSHKYADRSTLERLSGERGTCDDVLIVCNGFVTDTTIANVALFIDGRWLTPRHPLLKGTARARLIDEGFLHPAPLREEDIAKAQRVALMNAMMGFVEVENGIII
jgi:4-amino-4-deoxychorismate lyase